jgi:hypothetical protein
MNLPRSGSIRRALKGTIREIKAARKELNGRISKLMAHGEYEKAQAMIAQAKQTQSFEDEVQTLRKRLSALNGGVGDSKPAPSESRADWEYYQPILKCLADFPGEVTRPQIERSFSERFDSWLLPGDREAMSGGTRWQVMIKRSKKHMLSEGWIEARNKLSWNITPAGRKVAQQDQPTTQTK